MGCQREVCYGTSRPDASGQWDPTQRTPSGYQIHWWGWPTPCCHRHHHHWWTHSNWVCRTGSKAALQHKPFARLRIVILLHLGTSCCKHDCTHHAASRHQQVPDATSVWKKQKSHLGIDPRHNTVGCPTNTAGRQDQTGQLDQAPRLTSMRTADVWCILLGKRSGKQWSQISSMGITRTPLRCGQEGQRPTGVHHRCDVPWGIWTQEIRRRGQWESDASSRWQWNSGHIREVHDCEQSQRGPPLRGHEMRKPHGSSQPNFSSPRPGCIQRGWCTISFHPRQTSTAKMSSVQPESKILRYQLLALNKAAAHF